jgi:hypothetical protein
MNTEISSIPLTPHPYRFPVDADYVCLRPAVTLGGVTLRKGDRLPEDSPIRKLSRRLEILCEQRVLAPIQGTPPSGEDASDRGPASSSAPSREEADYDSMSVAQLRKSCEQLGLPTHGNRLMLLGRIRKHHS